MSERAWAGAGPTEKRRPAGVLRRAVAEFRCYPRRVIAVVLAELTDAQVRDLYADPAALSRQTDRSLSSIAQLIAALEEIRANGYGTNFEESEEGVGSVAIAVRDSAGVAVGAIAVAVPTNRLTQAVRREIVDTLLEWVPQGRLAEAGRVETAP